MGSGELDAAPPGNERASPTVLVVDDDLPTRRLAAIWLEKSGLAVHNADSGKTCLEMVHANPDCYSAIVLDVMMPDLDGFTVMERLRSDPRSAPIPVLLLTAHANDEESVLRGIQIGAAQHLAKPYSGAILVARVRALCAERDSRRALAEKLEQAESLATTDALTSLANRRAFDGELAREVAYSSRHHEPLSLVLIDIDFFKSINDLFGHAEGDRVLAHVARVMVVGLRESDGAFRIGGEEFAMILRGTDQDGARVVAERVNQAIRNSPVVFESGHEHVVTCSVGIATSDGANQFNVERLLQRADEAMYRAKRDGRDRVCSER